MIEVICEDGIVRHLPFRTLTDAEHWCEWGHCCTSVARHEFREAQAVDYT